jgi:hypothetical protein
VVPVALRRSAESGDPLALLMDGKQIMRNDVPQLAKLLCAQSASSCGTMLISFTALQAVVSRIARQRCNVNPHLLKQFIAHVAGLGRSCYTLDAVPVALHRYGFVRDNTDWEATQAHVTAHLSSVCDDDVIIVAPSCII